MMDIKVQHEDPSIQTSPLLTVHVTVISKTSTAPATTIPPPIPPFISLQQQSTSIPTPITIKATTSTTDVPDYETISAIHLRVLDLEKEVKELKNVDQSLALRATIKSKVSAAVKEYLETSLDDALYKVLQRHTVDLSKEHSILTDVVEKLKQQDKPQKSAKDIRKVKMEQVIKKTKHKALYHALMEFILEDEDAMDKGVADKLKNRKPNDVDRDEGPPAGSDQGLKRKKTSKETKPSKKAKSNGTSKSTQAEEIVFEAGDTHGPQNQGDDMGNTDEPPVVSTNPKEWFKKPKRPPTPYLEWNECKTIDNKPTQK
ncbi:hypothetical protein Tco_1288639 [Tanacetum coccineum]